MVVGCHRFAHTLRIMWSVGVLLGAGKEELPIPLAFSLSVSAAPEAPAPCGVIGCGRGSPPSINGQNEVCFGLGTRLASCTWTSLVSVVLHLVAPRHAQAPVDERTEVAELALVAGEPLVA